MHLSGHRASREEIDMSPTALASAPPAGGELPRHVHEALAAALRGLRFGSVELTVHDGAIVQIERRERIRPAGISAVA